MGTSGILSIRLIGCKANNYRGMRASIVEKDKHPTTIIPSNRVQIRTYWLFAYYNNNNNNNRYSMLPSVT